MYENPEKPNSAANLEKIDPLVERCGVLEERLEGINAAEENEVRRVCQNHPKQLGGGNPNNIDEVAHANQEYEAQTEKNEAQHEKTTQECGKNFALLEQQCAYTESGGIGINSGTNEEEPFSVAKKDPDIDPAEVTSSQPDDPTMFGQ